jgi:hypothetical protein
MLAELHALWHELERAKRWFPNHQNAISLCQQINPLATDAFGFGYLTNPLAIHEALNDAIMFLAPNCGSLSTFGGENTLSF